MNKKNFILILVLILIDQITKLLVINKKICVLKDIFYIEYAKNTGAAFGIGKLNGIIILNIILIILLICFIVVYSKRIKNYIPFYLILSGAISNFIDRICRGYVIDFINIDLFKFPIFNIADIYIVTGTILIFVFFKNIFSDT